MQAPHGLIQVDGRLVSNTSFHRLQRGLTLLLTIPPHGIHPGVLGTLPSEKS